jgi:hypothetical protein
MKKLNEILFNIKNKRIIIGTYWKKMPIDFNDLEKRFNFKFEKKMIAFIKKDIENGKNDLTEIDNKEYMNLLYHLHMVHMCFATSHICRQTIKNDEVINEKQK